MLCRAGDYLGVPFLCDIGTLTLTALCSFYITEDSMFMVTIVRTRTLENMFVSCHIGG
jgi:hypothetical protein